MIISLTLSNLHSIKPLHLPQFSVPSSLIAPKNQSQNPRTPSASVPDDIRSPACQERKLGNNNTLDKSTEALESKPIDPSPPGESPHHTDTPKHTHPAHSGAGDQHGVPVVGYPPGNEHISPPLQNEPSGNGHCSHHGVPMVGLVPPFPHAGTHPPHADQNNDIADGTSASHCGVPTVGLTTTPQNDSGTPSHADLGSKELVAVPHPHENEALKPASANTSAQCPVHEHAPAEAVRVTSQ